MFLYFLDTLKLIKLSYCLGVFFKRLNYFIFSFLNWRIITVLWWFLSYIDMKQPQVYMCSPSHPSGLSQCTSFECPVSCIKLGLVIYFTYGNYTCFNAILSNHPTLAFSHRSKSLFFISVSLLLSSI